MCTVLFPGLRKGCGLNDLRIEISSFGLLLSSCKLCVCAIGEDEPQTSTVTPGLPASVRAHIGRHHGLLKWPGAVGSARPGKLGSGE